MCALQVNEDSDLTFQFCPEITKQTGSHVTAGTTFPKADAKHVSKNPLFWEEVNAKKLIPTTLVI